MPKGAAEAPIWEYSRVGLKVRLWKSHMEVRRWGLLGPLMPEIVENWLYREIVGARTDGNGTKLVVMLRTGEEKSWLVGAKANEAQAALVRVLG